MKRHAKERSRRPLVLVLAGIGAVALLWWADTPHDGSPPATPGTRVGAPPPGVLPGASPYSALPPSGLPGARPYGAPPTGGPEVAAMANLSWEALRQGTTRLCDRYRSDASAIPGTDRAEHLRLCLDLLQAVTYRYYDWLGAHPAADLSPEEITVPYFLPVFSTIADAHPGVESAPEMKPFDKANAVRHYLGHEGYLFNFGIVYSSRGPGRFPSCQLERITDQRQLKQELWGHAVEVTLYVVDDPVIPDIITYFEGASWGAPMVTLDDIVVHHLDNEDHFVHTLRAEITDAFDRTGLDLMPPASRAGLQRELVYVALEPMRALGPSQAMVRFLEKWRETSYVHELAHVLVKRTGVAAPQSTEQEMIAYLTELRYGDTPHYSLSNISIMGEDRPLDPHGRAMHVLFDALALRIIEARRSAAGFDAIDCSFAAGSPTRSDLDRVALQFARLSEEEIRSLAQWVFERRFGG